MNNIYNTEEYWCGNTGYRPPGYGDFVVNSLKEILVLLYRPRSVLDIGCAYGFTVARFNSIGIPAMGIDISNLAISRAHKKIKDKLVEGSVCDMPFKDNSFDVALCTGVLEHIPKNKILKAVSEISRVCSRGIIGVAVTDDKTTLVDEDDTHECIMSLKEWREIFPESFLVISDSTDSWRIHATLSVAQATNSIEEH